MASPLMRPPTIESILGANQELPQLVLPAIRAVRIDAAIALREE